MENVSDMTLDEITDNVSVDRVSEEAEVFLCDFLLFKAIVVVVGKMLSITLHREYKKELSHTKIGQMELNFILSILMNKIKEQIGLEFDPSHDVIVCEGEGTTTLTIDLDSCKHITERGISDYLDNNSSKNVTYLDINMNITNSDIKELENILEDVFRGD